MISEERVSGERLDQLIDDLDHRLIAGNWGDVESALRDYAALRALVLASRPALETAVEMMTDIAAHGTASERMNGMFLAAQLRTLSAYGVGK